MQDLFNRVSGCCFTGHRRDALPALGDVLQRPRTTGGGPVLFKSCGWAGWDLAAARLAMRQGVVQ